MPYRHLSDVERDVIGQMHFAGHSFTEITLELDRHKSTISREVRRNGLRAGLERGFQRSAYFAANAQVKANERRNCSKQGLLRILDHRPLLKYVTDCLGKYWSPEQISGRIRIDFPNVIEMRVSHETIYVWIRQNERRPSQTGRVRRRTYQPGVS